jgi:hypothetical protein
MSEFLFLFRGSTRLTRSPEETQKSMQKWVAWFKELNEKGVVKDPGNPLDASGKLVRGHAKDVHDGPFAEAKDLVNGYVVIETATIDAAVALSKGCPILDDSGSVEVRPLLKL